MFPNLPYKGDQIPNQPFNYPEVPATFDRLFGSLVPNIQLDPIPGTAVEKWERPADWLPLPDISSTEEKFAGLFPIYNVVGNLVALEFEGGNYTVDWGDGTVEDYNGGDKAQHSFDWDDIPADTETSAGYRQVVITAVPQSGQNLSIMNLAVRHDYVNLVALYPWGMGNSEADSPWLDIKVSLPNAESGKSLKFGSYGSTYLYLRSLERVHIVNAGGMSDFTECFFNCRALRSFTMDVSPNADSFYYMFDECNSLTDVELNDTSTVTTVEYMFYDCYSLRVAPMFDTSNVETMYGMFEYCYNLESAPDYNTSNVTDFREMFYSCYPLSSAPTLDMSKAESVDSMFDSCYGLTNITMPPLPLVTSASSLFSSCYSLSNVSLPPMPLLESANGMFSNCYSLESIVLPATPLLSSAYYMFQSSNLRNVVITSGSLTYLEGTFGYCRSIESISLDASSVTTATYFATPAPNLQSVILTGLTVAINLRYCLLSREAIVALFESLGSGGSTVDVRNNYGASSLTAGDRQIAIDKGWTVLY